MTAASTPGEGEGFLRRWARRKNESLHGVEPAPEPASELAPASLPPAAADPLPAHGRAAGVVQPESDAATAAAAAARLPTMDDVAQLTSESDFSAFVARDVDQAVRRSALKKLFADPHFNVMDKLDMYMDDYNVASPVSAEMLASLNHSKSFFKQAADVAEAARKRAEAALGIDAGGVAEAPATPEVAATEMAEPPQALLPEDAGDDAGTADVREAAPLPPGARIVPETAAIMQNQP
jgi:hypothetical protein